MKTVYLIPGYGIPKDIGHDDHYRDYLHTCFNAIFDASHDEPALCILSGGKTDMFRPYRRTEAGEMKKFLVALAKRPFVRKATRGWSFVTEVTSLSTLDNLLLTKNIFTKRGLTSGKLVIFCEQTRKKKITVLAKKIFGSRWSISVRPVDFDISQNRYHIDLVEKKEREALRLALWALKSPQSLKAYRKVFKGKITYLRKQGPNNHPEEIKRWWEMRLKSLEQFKY